MNDYENLLGTPNTETNPLVEIIKSLVEEYLGGKEEIIKMTKTMRKISWWTAIAGLTGTVLWILNSIADLILKF
jgi:hypothetical protein